MAISPPDKGPERILIYFPIIHTQADMGAFSEAVRQANIEKSGEKALRRKVTLIDNMWNEIERAIEGMNLPYTRVRLYQDGLPLCGREVEIVTELAEAGSRNHQLLLHLKNKGAVIMGTESSELLILEYQLARETLAQRDTGLKAPGEIPPYEGHSDSLLIRRDQVIADVINKTLRPGETGILFLGLLHSLKNKLDKEISIIYPITLELDRGGMKDA